MKYVLLLLCFGCIAFSSCDGRTTKHESLKKSVKAFRNAKYTPKIIKTFPEQYAEVKTDTILSNGYRVTIKNFTNMDKMVQLSKFSKIDKTQHFRQIDSEITVYKDDKLIYTNVMHNVFSKYYNNTEIDIKQYLNNGISVDEIASLEQNKVIIKTSNAVPQSRQNPYFNLSIDEFGNSKFKKIDDART